MYTSDLISQFNSSVSLTFSKYLKLIWVDPLRKFWSFEIVNPEYYSMISDPSFEDSIKLEILKNTIKGNDKDMDLIREIPYGDMKVFQVTNIDISENFKYINFDDNWEYLANMIDFYRELSNDGDPYLTDYFQLESLEVIDNINSLPQSVINLITDDDGDQSDLEEDVSICKYHLKANELDFYSLNNRDILRDCINDEILEIMDPNDDFHLDYDFKNHTLDLYILGWN